MKQRPDLERWLPLPDGVSLGDSALLPTGFRAGGISAGSKPSGALDLGVLTCDEPAMTSAARFTPSATAAAHTARTRLRPSARRGQSRARKAPPTAASRP